VAVDWLAIRNDYINGGGSYRKLAEKYGVSFNTLKEKAVEEGWAKLKEDQHHKITTRTQQKTQDKLTRLVLNKQELAVKLAGIYASNESDINKQQKIQSIQSYMRAIDTALRQLTR
jgi:uncharacterized protein YjcR